MEPALTKQVPACKEVTGCNALLTRHSQPAAGRNADDHVAAALDARDDFLHEVHIRGRAFPFQDSGRGHGRQPRLLHRPSRPHRQSAVGVMGR